MTRLVALYPRAWRDRYEEEFLALLADRPPDPVGRLDIVRGAVDARLHPQVAGSPDPTGSPALGSPWRVRAGWLTLLGGSTLDRRDGRRRERSAHRGELGDLSRWRGRCADSGSLRSCCSVRGWSGSPSTNPRRPAGPSRGAGERRGRAALGVDAVAVLRGSDRVRGAGRRRCLRVAFRPLVRSRARDPPRWRRRSVGRAAGRWIGPLGAARARPRSAIHPHRFPRPGLGRDRRLTRSCTPAAPCPRGPPGA